MNRRIAAAFALLLAVTLPAQAAAATDHAALRERALVVLEGQFGAFRDAARTLADASAAHCAGGLDRDGYVQAFRAAWLAWAPLDAYQFGPVEQTGAALTIGFWPDKKDFVGRGLDALTAAPPEAQADPEVVATHSAAAQGLPAIERLLHDDAYAPCPAIVGIAGHVARVADTLHAGWFESGGWADLARSAGGDNPVYDSDAEFTKALFTAVDFALSRIVDARLGRPLGSFDAPKPTQGEAWRAGLGLAIVDAQLAGIAALLTEGFDGALDDATRSEAEQAIAEVRARIGRIEAPLDVAVADPMTRFPVEALQTAVQSLRDLFAARIGPALGVETGFSPADGD